MDFGTESDSESDGFQTLEDNLPLVVPQANLQESEEEEEEEEDEEIIIPDEEEENVIVPFENTFDMSLPTTHSYLGQNLDELRGRVLLDDGIYENLPLLVKHSVILFPGQTLPLKVYGTQTTHMFETCLQKHRTFGVVGLGDNKKVHIGTTAEIYEYLRDPNVHNIRLKAKGRQRFKILRVIIEGYDMISANVKILPEITLRHPFLEERLASLNYLRVQATNEEELKKQERIERIDAIVTPWPSWVYKQYDPVKLSRKIRQHLHFLEQRGGNIPEDPVELSFWVAQNVLLDDNEKIDLLNYDCAISRLQKEIKYLIEDRTFVCSKCDAFIAYQSDMFPMSKDGPQSTYCNPDGIIHEIITLYRAEGLMLGNDPPSTVYSWFPGYAWTVATCRNCDFHMGWKFTAVENNLKPKSFWGLTRKGLSTCIKK